VYDAPPSAAAAGIALNARAAKLALGTVQWGMSYGIANRTGQASAADIARMLELARGCGVSVLDTARAYGDAEKAVGAQAGAGAFRVVTKLAADRSDSIGDAALEAARASVTESLRNLGRERVYGCLVHNARNLLVSGGERLWGLLTELRASGVVARIGASVYEPAELEQVLERYPLDLVQLPFNVYDQRFLRSGLLAALKQSGVEVHARSAFLQGLLLLAPADMPERFAALRPHQARLHRALADNGLTPLAGALQFALRTAEIDHVVVGAETHGQLQEIIAAAGAKVGAPAALDDFALSDETVINPSNWR
jgi:aryl-alcohol dehydrogenase-like predicted oxidoreductase